ncbi:helix-turn-helix domain-containing protein [Ilumatobacter sp.]|uniref:helix-turn-helix domain-containing protein n=1 Tax=Ilumatobacter sp. TaxID=1967498 RepID=UPI003C76F51D
MRGAALRGSHGSSSAIVFDAVACAGVPFRSRRCLYRCMTRTSPATRSAHHHDVAGPLLFDVAQAALMLSISRSSIYQLIWSEQLIPVRIGRSVRFSVEQLEQFVADRISGVGDSNNGRCD